MQTPRSILVHIDSSLHSAVRVHVARLLAEDFDAEVIAQPCMLAALARYPFAVEGAGAAIEMMLALDREGLDKAHATFIKASAGSPRLHWAEPLAEGPWDFVPKALYADLLVLGQREQDDPASGELPFDFVPSVLLHSGKPALILPYAGEVAPVARTVLVAWKETRESARAVTAALPWLQRASKVHVVAYGEGSEASLRALERYLKVNGVTVTKHTGGPEEKDVGSSLLSMAADVSAELLVMGCYGHSRAREWVLGGATHTILQTMTLPVLMSH